MPRKSYRTKPARPSPKLVDIGIAAAATITTGGIYAYAKLNNKPLAIQIAGQGIGVWFDPDTGQPHVETGQFGCCLPYCSNSFEIEGSSEHGLGNSF